jgi:hypothetical protein
MHWGKLPAGFIVPAQPVERETPAGGQTPPAGADWAHEIKHDGYRMIVCRGAAVRLRCTDLTAQPARGSRDGRAIESGEHCDRFVH